MKDQRPNKQKQKNNQTNNKSPKGAPVSVNKENDHRKSNGRNSAQKDSFKPLNRDGLNADKQYGRKENDNRNFDNKKQNEFVSKPNMVNKDIEPQVSLKNDDLIYGRHPVMEALKNDTPINKLWIAEGMRETREITDLLKEKNIPFKIVERSKLNELVGDNVNHQGVVAGIAGKTFTEFEELLELCKTKTVFFVLLDKVEDPHNLGAIIRTADAAGVDAIIIPKHRAVGLTGVVSKTSAGALERMRVCRVTNLVQAIESLKENQVWVVGVDMDGKDIYSDANLKGAIALVMGGEGQGVTKLIKESCDFIVRIPMQSKANSLNVSVASAILVYEIYKQRGFKS